MDVWMEGWMDGWMDGWVATSGKNNLPEASECDVWTGISLTASQCGHPLRSEVNDVARQNWVFVEIPEMRNCFPIFFLLFFGLDRSLYRVQNGLHGKCSQDTYGMLSGNICNIIPLGNSFFVILWQLYFCYTARKK